MLETSVALVTGANKGIGLQIAKDLVKKGYKVILGSRKLDAGRAAAALIGEGASAVYLDVTQAHSIAEAAEHIKEAYGRLDVLVNNAGVSHLGGDSRAAEDIAKETYLSVVDLNEMRGIFETNVFGVVAVTQAMLPLLRESPAGRIVNVSSETGSLTLNADRQHHLRQYAGTYSSSKTALNAVTQAFAIELEGTNIKVNAVCPGFTATDNNRFLGPQTVEQAARAPVHAATLGSDGRSGEFVNVHGHLPW